MKTNEKICKWLGMTEIKDERIYKRYNYYGEIIFDDKIDFLHDRNQQKWIIDELKKRKYSIKIFITENYATAIIYRGGIGEFRGLSELGDDGPAFIDAVEQLIDNENDTSKNLQS